MSRPSKLNEEMKQAIIQKKKGIYRNCKVCGKLFYVFPYLIKRKKYCSLQCKNKDRDSWQTKGPNSKHGLKKFICPECGIIFYYWKSKKDKKFCSLECRNINYSKRRGVDCNFFGKKHSVQTRIRLANINRLIGNKPPSRKGIPSWNKGVPNENMKGDGNPMRKIENRIKNSIAQKGNKGNNWKGGISSLNKRIRAGIDFKTWREAIFKRDNYTCKECGVKGGILHPHHILHFAKYPNLRFEVNNGITLCKPCHEKQHPGIKFN